MKKTLSALLLLGTVMASTASQARAEQDCSAGQSSEANILITATRQMDCGMEVGNKEIKFTPDNYPYEQKVSVRLVTNATGDNKGKLTVKSANGALKHTDIGLNAKIRYKIKSDLFNFLSENPQDFMAGQEVDIYDLHLDNDNAEISIELDAEDYIKADPGEYKDTLTLTFTYAG